MNFYSLINKGYKGELISLQCTSHQGFPSFDITGLADSVIKESKDRIREALRNSGFHFPHEAILINLLPQNLEKTGTTLDLGIALSLLFQKTNVPLKVFTLGELDLNGNILPTPGVENALELSKRIKANVLIISSRSGIKTHFQIDKKCQFIKDGNLTIIEALNIAEAFDLLLEAANEMVEEEDKRDASENLNFDHDNYTNDDVFRANTALSPTSALIQNAPFSQNSEFREKPFKGIIGLKAEKEALAVAIAGGHSLILFGSKGVGKTLLLSRIPYLLPHLDEKTKSELSRIRSCFDMYGTDKSNVTYIDSSNKTSVFQASSNSKYPELLLSHGGIAVLDELTSFDEKTLSLLRSIHDMGSFTIRGKEVFPLRLSLIAAMNPCPCGNRGSRLSPCNCSENRIRAHLKNIQTPLLSRFDEVYPIEEASFLEDDDSGFDNIVERIERARERQYKRYESEPYIRLNGDLGIYTSSDETIKKAFMYFPDSENPRDALLHYGVALTLADLDESNEITPLYVQKAKLLKVSSIERYYEK